MTTIAHKLVTSDASGAEVVVRAGVGAPVRRGAAPKHLSLAWSLSRDAAAAAGLVGPDGGAVVLQLRVPWKRGVERMHAAVIDGNRTRDLEVAESGSEWASEGGLWHLEIPGVLRVSVREVPWMVLYARTGLLAALGVGGGRYEFESGELVDTE